MIIKFLLLLGLALVATLAYRSPLSARNSALRRLAGAAILGGGACAVLWPNLLSELAQILGVGRGADLMLYVFAVVSMFVWLSLYRHVHDLKERLAELTRQLAIFSAEGPADEFSSNSRRGEHPSE